MNYLEEKMSYNFINMPRDLTIFISGTTSVGKTTVARILVNKCDQILVMQEYDLIREAVRSIYFDRIPQSLEYEKIMNSSTSCLSYQDLQTQSYLLIKPLIAVCKRLKSKGIPAVIEGVNICFDTLFNSPEFLQYLSETNNNYFFNLYLENENEHKQRLIKHKSLTQNKDFEKIFSSVRKNNLRLHESARKFEINNTLKIDGYSEIKLNVYDINLSDDKIRNDSNKAAEAILLLFINTL